MLIVEQGGENNLNFDDMSQLYSLFIVLLFNLQLIASQPPTTLYHQEGTLPSDISLSKQKICSKGDFKGLVILVEFSDVKFTISNPKQRFRAMLNHKGYSYQGSHGSVRDYFISNSDSLFFPMFKVVGPVKLNKPMSYYGTNGTSGAEIHASELIMDACKLVSSQVKFSDYDTNNDGMVDMAYVFFSSFCENENQSHKEYIWSHAGNITDSCLVLDNVTIGRYACSSEYIGEYTADNPPMATIGTFCHEFGHVLGLPDFYNTLSGTGLTLGSLSIMDRGNYLDNGRCPVGYSAFEREYCGWLDVPILERSDSVTLVPVNQMLMVGKELRAFKIAIPNSQEYYYIENRQSAGWDRFLPGKGMLIYHVDRSDERAWDQNEVNTNYAHPYYQIIRSGGKYTTDYQKIPFPGKNKVTSFISPPLWNGEYANFELRDINEQGEKLKFTLIYQ